MKLLSKSLLLSALFTTSVFAAVNLNTATKEELMSLEGIGESKAEAIIQHRQTKEFKSIEDLKEVKGIGDKNYEKIKKDIAISGETKIDQMKDSGETKIDQMKDRGEKKVKSTKNTKEKAEKKAKDSKDKTEKKMKDSVSKKTKEVKE